MNDYLNFKQNEDTSFNPAYIIVGVFLFLVFGLIAYVYFANKSMIESGYYKTKKYGKKSKKSQFSWSFEG